MIRPAIASLLRKLVVFIITVAATFGSSAQKNPVDTIFKPTQVLASMEKVAGWQLHQWDTGGFKRRKYDWTYAAAYTGFMELAAISKDKKYENAMLAIGNDLNWNTGVRRFMADDYCVAQMYCKLYAIYKDEKMILPFRQQADTIIQQPHTESLEWKDNIANREWAWCDALFMGPPAFAYLHTATGERKYLDIADKLWWKTTDYLFDKDENLYFRDSRFFTQKEANGRKVFWSRGNGWVMGGLVRMLDNMPDDYPDRGKYVELYEKMAEKIAALQSKDGTWHAALLDAKSYPAKEASGTGFYCYALAYGINHGLISYDKYHKVVEKAWKALMGCVQPDGKLGYVQQIGEKPEKVTADDTEVYGVGAFLLAGSEIYRMMEKHS